MSNHHESTEVSSAYVAEHGARETLIRKVVGILKDETPGFPAIIASTVEKYSQKTGFPFDSSDIEMEAIRVCAHEIGGGSIPERLQPRFKELAREEFASELAEMDPENDPTTYYQKLPLLLAEDGTFSFMGEHELARLEDEIYERADELRRESAYAHTENDQDDSPSA